MTTTYLSPQALPYILHVYDHNLVFKKTLRSLNRPTLSMVVNSSGQPITLDMPAADPAPLVVQGDIIKISEQSIVGQPLRIIVARKSVNQTGQSRLAIWFRNEGYNVTEKYNATVAECRAYDIVVVDDGEWSAGADSAFVQSLWNDGQRIIVAGNDTDTSMFYATSQSGTVTIGTSNITATAHPIATGVGTLETDTDTGVHIRGIVAGAIKLGDFVGDAAGYSIIEYPHATSGGNLIHLHSAGVSNGPQWQKLRANVVSYLSKGRSDILYAGIIEDLPDTIDQTTEHQITLAPLGIELGETDYTHNYTSATDISQMIRDAVAGCAHLTATTTTVPNTGLTRIFNFNETNVLTVLQTAAKMAGSNYIWFVDELGQVWFGPTSSGTTYSVKTRVDAPVRKYTAPITTLKNYVKGFGAVIPNTDGTRVSAVYDQTAGSPYGRRAHIPPLHFPNLTDQATLQSIVNTVGASLNQIQVTITLELPNYGQRINLAQVGGASVKYFEPTIDVYPESDPGSGVSSPAYVIMQVDVDGPIQTIVARGMALNVDDFVNEINDTMNRVATDTVPALYPITPGQMQGATQGGASTPATPGWDFPNWSTGIENTAQVNNAYVIIKWTPNIASDNTAYYEIRYSKLADGNYFRVATASPAALDGNGKVYLKIAGLLQGTSYTFEVRAINNLGIPSAWSSTQAYVTGADVTAPSVPTGLAVISTIRGALLSWNGNTEADLQGYEIQVQINGGSFSLVTPSWSLMTSLAYVAPGGTANGSTLGFQVRAADWSGNISGWSSTVSVTMDTVKTTDVGFIIGGGNLVSNSSFEDATGLAGTSPYNQNLITASYDSGSGPPFGTYAYKVQRNTGGDAYFFMALPGIAGASLNGKKVTVSIYVKADSASSLYAVPALQDESGHYIPADSGSAAVPTTETRLVFPFTLGGSAFAGTDPIHLVLRPLADVGSNNVYFDGVQVEIGDTVTAYAPKTDEILTAQVVSNAIAAAAVTTGKIADANITTAKIANAAITNALIANLAVATANIQDAAIVSAKIADANITTVKIANAAITTALIANAAITNALIANLAVATANIQDLAITNAKVASMTIDKLLAGSLQVFGTLIAGGGLRTASSGARLVLDSTGLRIYDNTSTDYGDGAGVTVELKNDGSAFFKGTLGANVVTAVSINAGAVSADKLAATLILASTIKAGSGAAHTEMDGNGFRAYDASNNIVIDIPNDGRPVTVNANLIGKSLNVTGNAIFQGTQNEFAFGSVSILDSSQGNPTQAPAVASGWDSITIPLDSTYDGTSVTHFGLAYDSAGGAGGATKVFWTLAFNSQTNQTYPVELLASTRAINRVVAALTGSGSTVLYSICRHGSYVYILWQNNISTTFFVDRFLASTLASDAHYTPDMPTALWSGSYPSICSDGTNLYIVDRANTTEVKWNKYDSAMVKVGSTIATGYNAPYFPAASYAGNADLGAFRIITSHGDGMVRVFDSAGSRQTNEEFSWPNASPYSGITYGDALGDGARFWTQPYSQASIVKHSNWVWTTASSIYWVGYSWYDSNATGGTHETTVGPRASITLSRRQQLTITAPPLPGAGGTDDPNNIRFYMLPNATDPGVAGLKLQATQSALTLLATTYASGGAADPASNNFPTGTAAQMKSQATGFNYKGSGLRNYVGTVFPSSPVTNDHYWRSDIGMEFFYDGTRWVTAQLFQCPTSTNYATTVNGSFANAIPALPTGCTDIWLVDHVLQTFASATNNGSNYWINALTKYNSANAGTNIDTSIATNGDTQATWVKHTFAINALLGTTYFSWSEVWTKSGTPGQLNANGYVSYRFVAT